MKRDPLLKFIKLIQLRQRAWKSKKPSIKLINDVNKKLLKLLSSMDFSGTEEEKRIKRHKLYRMFNTK